MLHNAGFIISSNCRIVKIELFLVLLQLLYSLDIGKQTVPRVINYGAKIQVQQDKTLHASSFSAQMQQKSSSYRNLLSDFPDLIHVDVEREYFLIVSRAGYHPAPRRNGY